MIGTFYETDNAILSSRINIKKEDMYIYLSKKEFACIINDFYTSLNSKNKKDIEFYSIALIIKITSFDPKILCNKNLNKTLNIFIEAIKNIYDVEELQKKELEHLQFYYSRTFKWLVVANKEKNRRLKF